MTRRPSALIAQIATRRPLLWVTDGERRACVEPGNLENLPPPLGAMTPAKGDSPALVYRAYAPVRRLVVVGSDPIALSLLRLASEMGFETILIRPRGPDGPPAYVARYFQSEIRGAFETPWSPTPGRPSPW